MDLSLNILPIVIYACFTLHNFCEQHKAYVDHEQVQKQVELIKANEEEHANLPDPVYSTNSDEGDIVRRILTSYIRTYLPDHLTQFITHEHSKTWTTYCCQFSIDICFVTS